MNTLLQDIRYGVRMLRKSPAFTLIAVLTLALGIGANTALFSVVNGVLLNPLPYPHPDQLVVLHAGKPNFAFGSISYPNFVDWQKNNHTFSAIAAYRSLVFNLTGSGDAEQLFGEYVTSDFFPILGTKPVIGRSFLKDEDRIGGPPLVMISAGLWRKKFASSPDVLSKPITLNGAQYTVIGVVPADFSLPLGNFQASDLYIPMGQFDKTALQHRDWGLGIHGIGRLKPGVTLAEAKADMEAVSRDLALAYPEFNKDTTAKVRPLRDQVVGYVRPYLITLLAAVGFVLLIACVNVANLVLARSVGRTREFAIRAALGAARGRVVRQMLTESLMLSIVGGVLGVLFAGYGTHAALAALPRVLPRSETISVDGRVLIFTAALIVITGMLAGIIPALSRNAHTDLSDTLKATGRTVTSARHRVQNVFVVAQMALAMVLLIGAGLMVRTLVYLWHVDPGFNPQNIVTFGMSFPAALNTADPETIRQQYHQLEDQLVTLPGIKDVSFLWGALPLGDDDETYFWVDGRPKPSQNDMPMAINYIVSPSYLQAMSIPLQSGRFFTRQDDEHAPSVVVIDTTFARKFYPNEDPIGKRLHMQDERVVEIIGVVGHVKQWSLDNDSQISPLQEQFYFPWAQVSDQYTKSYGSGSFTMARGIGGDAQVMSTLRTAVRQISSEMVIANSESMSAIVADSFASRRFTMILLSIFAGLALLLASIGIYGVIAYAVGQRTQEIGVRIALGAERFDILRMVLSSGGRLLAIGIGVGMVAALGLTRLMSSQLSGVKPTDPLTFVAVGALLAMVALLACYVPARRASKVDPMVALRYD
ncbi:ABC efflux pump, inner membrane subunit [Candidatus Koribacter versatilis Ellin345]|uniref:ABC efflux pump, inner membrane subunit n=1 Tax=Koribacter versatilis (strain Ellin345) TaxID=204669 RepID=Q1IKZ0_KORVE|nr:ABC transporter permease [Candidatus Koribacter versatilis]ABF42460.1 ABC efflux pump, inner membrane subunit [Candidatus Koribacter versatilis Ellin345]